MVIFPFSFPYSEGRILPVFSALKIVLSSWTSVISVKKFSANELESSLPLRFTTSSFLSLLFPKSSLGEGVYFPFTEGMFLSEEKRSSCVSMSSIQSFVMTCFADWRDPLDVL